MTGDDSITSDSQGLPHSISSSRILPQPSLPSPIPPRSPLSSPVTSRYSTSLPVGRGSHHPWNSSKGPFRQFSLLTPPPPDEIIFFDAQKVNQIFENERHMSSGASSSANLDSLEMVSGTS